MDAAYELPCVNENRGDQKLFKVDPPYCGHEYLIVSAINNEFGVETYIFGANADSEIVDFTELEGSFRGGMDHGLALSNAGYTIQHPKES